MSARIPEDAVEQIRKAGADLPLLPLDDMGEISCEPDDHLGEPYAMVRMHIDRNVYTLDKLPFNSERIAQRIRQYLSPQVEIGQSVLVFDDCDPVRVVFIDNEKQEFRCETGKGDRRGPYRFGDMMYTWKKE